MNYWRSPLVAGVIVTLIALLGALVTKAEAAPARFTWPLQPRPQVVRGYDNPPQPWLPGHRGVDLAGEVGATVLAPAPGTVVFAGSIGGRPVISLDHGGVRTTYEPVTAMVRTGARVAGTDPIGTLLAGHPGCPVAACLHWGALRGRSADNDYLNPLLLLQLRMRLKPLHL